ncbi:MAG: mercuric transporter MerT family protein [Candidatus Poribacteria bacterium]|nr:mercuric transporter MerT family protein [Candidatus Poribacteria bacterium]
MDSERLNSDTTQGTGWFSAGAVLAGIGAATCCLGPVLVALGFSGIGFLTQIEPYRPVFIAVAVGLLGYAFYRTYCQPVEGEACCPQERLRIRKIVLWMAATLTMGGIFFPYLLAAFS